jgi:uncharacterized protein (DUF1684 family)
VTNILGDTEPTSAPAMKFVIDGQEIHLEAVDEGESYFFNFRDRTSGKTTYPAVILSSMATILKMARL